jgi:hypothetical protein
MPRWQCLQLFIRPPRHIPRKSQRRSFKVPQPVQLILHFKRCQHVPVTLLCYLLHSDRNFGTYGTITAFYYVVCHAANSRLAELLSNSITDWMKTVAASAFIALP